MGGGYAVGVVSFLEAPLWVKGQQCVDAILVGGSGWFISWRLPRFSGEGALSCLSCCSFVAPDAYVRSGGLPGLVAELFGGDVCCS
jgi:hypothetical protein